MFGDILNHQFQVECLFELDVELNGQLLKLSYKSVFEENLKGFSIFCVDIYRLIIIIIIMTLTT